MKILKGLNPEELIFLDIETAPQVKELKLDTELFSSWEYKKKRDGLDNIDLVKTYQDEAGLYPEFGKVVSIVAGVIRGGKLHTKTYDDPDEAVLLQGFNDLLDKAVYQNKKTRLCHFAGIGFDIPFVAKRSMINGIPLSQLIDTQHLKPWEVTDIDIKVLWKGTSWNTASLLNIATAFGLPSPKDDIAGSEVGKVFWNEGAKGLQRISVYCRKDVLATCNIFLKMRGDEVIEFADSEVEVKEIPLGILTYLHNGGKYTPKIKAKLQKALKPMNTKDKAMAIEILNSIPTKAKGKVTDITKADVKELA